MRTHLAVLTRQSSSRRTCGIAPVPSLPEIRLYTAHPGSGLRRLADPQQSSDADDDTVEPDDDTDDHGPEPQPPYWAYAWAGGAVLARYILDHPQSVAGRRVLDLGAGSGLVGIAAAKAGASAVIAAEIDRNGVAAIGLNAAANGVAITRGRRGYHHGSAAGGRPRACRRRVLRTGGRRPRHAFPRALPWRRHRGAGRRSRPRRSAATAAAPARRIQGAGFRRGERRRAEAERRLSSRGRDAPRSLGSAEFRPSP